MVRCTRLERTHALKERLDAIEEAHLEGEECMARADQQPGIQPSQHGMTLGSQGVHVI